MEGIGGGVGAAGWEGRDSRLVGGLLDGEGLSGRFRLYHNLGMAIYLGGFGLDAGSFVQLKHVFGSRRSQKP